jgi:type IV pilus assembly protein PilW
MITHKTFPGSNQRGFSLVELMVAVTLGFIVVAAVGYLYLGSRQSFRNTENMSRMQESARYALDTMARDVRMAGSLGCTSLVEAAPTLGAPIPAALVPAPTNVNAVVGGDVGTNPPGVPAATVPRVAGDALSIWGAQGSSVTLASITAGANPYAYKTNDILAVVTCRPAADAPPVATLRAAPAGLATLPGAPADEVMEFDRFAYYIGTNPAGIRALYRNSVNDGVAELVEGVEDMQILYGVDTTAVPDRIADVYQTAGAVADWTRVVSARISLLMASPGNNLTTTAQTYRIDTDDDGTPNAVVAADRRIYQTFSTTVGIRNRLQ